MPIMNISRLNVYAVCALDTITALLAVSLAPLLLHPDYAGSVRGCVSDDQGVGSLGDTVFVAKLSRVRK